MKSYHEHYDEHDINTLQQTSSSPKQTHQQTKTKTHWISQKELAESWSRKRTRRIKNTKSEDQYRRADFSKMMHKFKFYNMKTSNEYNWPFVDVKYYKVTGDTVNKMEFKNIERQTLSIPMSRFYPLHKRPFGDLWLPSPRDPREWLHRKYNRFQCSQGKWNHIKERSIKRQLDVPCEQLLDVYPFVTRSVKDGLTHEQLIIGSHIIQSVVIPEAYTTSHNTRMPI